MKCEMRQCQVRIDSDVANVMMLAQTTDGKVTQLVMRYNEFENHSTEKGNGTH